MAFTTAQPSSASSRNDPSAAHSTTLQLLTRLAAREGRLEAAQTLAAHLGAEELLVFVEDTELGVLLPALGFPQTLPRGSEWGLLLLSSRKMAESCGMLPSPSSGRVLPALCCTALDGSVLVILGGSPSVAEVRTVSLLLPLLGAAYRGEQAVYANRGRAEVARQIAEQARLLTEGLEAARRSLQSALLEAQEADRRKNEFLAMLAHELRNPLAPIAGALEVIGQRAAADPIVARNQAAATRQIFQLRRLVDDLLDMSRITSGKIELRTAPLDLVALIEQTLETGGPQLQERSHELHIQLPPEALWVNGDPVRLVQVFANLLINAAKFTEPGGRVEVTARRENGFARVSVRDSGIGILPELLPQVFELFTQGPAPLDRAQGGLGIGLTLVRRLLALHGGTVEAWSEGPGSGSEFIVRLPLLQAAGRPAQGIRAPTCPSPDHEVRSRRILVVDDNVDAAETLADVLLLWGYEAESVYDGEAALRSAARSRPHAVLLDIGLPGMDGYEVAGRLHALPGLGTTVLIALTGYGQEDDVRRSHEAGIDHHLTKPVDLERLQQLLADPSGST